MDEQTIAALEEALEDEYIKRTSPFAKLSIEILKEAKFDDVEKVKADETSRIIAKLNKDDCNILLDRNGDQVSSEKLSKLIETTKNSSQNITFIVGGTYGASESLNSHIDLKLSFSKMTFTHLMIRPLLLEQIYRAFTIIQGKKYHY